MEARLENFHNVLRCASSAALYVLDAVRLKVEGHGFL